VLLKRGISRPSLNLLLYSPRQALDMWGNTAGHNLAPDDLTDLLLNTRDRSLFRLFDIWLVGICDLYRLKQLQDLGPARKIGIADCDERGVPLRSIVV